MKGTGIAFLSIIACIIMMLPSISFAELAPAHNVPSYSYNGMTLSFENQKAEIVANGQSSMTSWTVDLVNNSSLTQEKFSNYTINRIANAYQNSFAVLLKNHDVQVAEVYTLNLGSIDASIAVKNLLPQNSTYVITFVTTMNHHRYVTIGGITSNTLDLPYSSQSNIHTLDSQSWYLNDQYIGISWQSEIAMFHGGIFASTSSNNILSLPFGPITIVNNESYSIDPRISPDLIKPPPGGGGGGGGGGSAPTPPSISSFEVSSYPNVFENGTQDITFTYSISSFGSYSSAIVGFFVATDNSATTYATKIGTVSVSNTGIEPDYTFNFNWIGQWHAFVVAVWYPYDNSWDYEKSAGNSFIVYEKTSYPFDYPNNAYNGPGNNVIIDTSTGSQIAEIYGNIYGAHDIRTGGSPTDFFIQSGIAPKNNSFQVNKVGMYVKYVGNNLGQTPSYMKTAANGYQGLDQYVAESSNQSYEDKSDYKNVWPIIASVLWTVAFAAASAATDGTASILFATGGALDPFLFLPYTSQSSPIIPPMNLTYEKNAGSVTGYAGPWSWNTLGTTYYSGYVPHFQPSLIFSIEDSMTWNNPTENAPTQYAVDYMQYTVNYSIVDINDNLQVSGPGMPPLYSGSYTVFMFLPEEVASTT